MVKVDDSIRKNPAVAKVCIFALLLITAVAIWWSRKTVEIGRKDCEQRKLDFQNREKLLQEKRRKAPSPPPATKKESKGSKKDQQKIRVLEEMLVRHAEDAQTQDKRHQAQIDKLVAAHNAKLTLMQIGFQALQTVHGEALASVKAEQDRLLQKEVDRLNKELQECQRQLEEQKDALVGELSGFMEEFGGAEEGGGFLALLGESTSQAERFSEVNAKMLDQLKKVVAGEGVSEDEFLEELREVQDCIRELQEEKKEFDLETKRLQLEYTDKIAGMEVQHKQQLVAANLHLKEAMRMEKAVKERLLSEKEEELVALRTKHEGALQALEQERAAAIAELQSKLKEQEARIAAENEVQVTESRQEIEDIRAAFAAKVEKKDEELRQLSQKMDKELKELSQAMDTLGSADGGGAAIPSSMGEIFQKHRGLYQRWAEAQQMSEALQLQVKRSQLAKQQIDDMKEVLSPYQQTIPKGKGRYLKKVRSLLEGKEEWMRKFAQYNEQGQALVQLELKRWNIGVKLMEAKIAGGTPQAMKGVRGEYKRMSDRIVQAKKALRIAESELSAQNGVVDGSQRELFARTNYK
ncbi:hypothetical protein K0U07_03010 [bacterium]|nr:hypothetical protein [bacterium]